jgi:hypothetical protein
MIGRGDIEPYVIKKNKKKEHNKVSYWTALVRSLVWKEANLKRVDYAEFIIDPDGLAAWVINEACAFESSDYRVTDRSPYSKEVTNVVLDLVLQLRKMNVPNFWNNLANKI